MTKMTERKKCSHSGCRKMRVLGGETCKVHSKSNGTDPTAHVLEQVLRMTELESYKLAALDSELRNHLLSVQNHDLKLAKLTSDFEVTKRAIQEERKQSIAAFEIKNNAYQDFVKVLAERYGLDPNKMSFDTDSQILRDLRGESEA